MLSSGNQKGKGSGNVLFLWQLLWRSEAGQVPGHPVPATGVLVRSAGLCARPVPSRALGLDGEDVLIQPGGREAENEVIETPSSCAVSSPSASAEQLGSPSILEQKLVFWETTCFPVTEGNYFSHLRET